MLIPIKAKKPSVLLDYYGTDLVDLVEHWATYKDRYIVVYFLFLFRLFSLKQHMLFSNTRVKNELYTYCVRNMNMYGILSSVNKSWFFKVYKGTHTLRIVTCRAQRFIATSLQHNEVGIQ
jgi:hypothetical protein